MYSPSGRSFFSLPRELRDTIYHLYFLEPEGYHYDLASGKLRTSTNQSINVALMRTCKSINAETNQLALRSNILHFTTSAEPSEVERTKSARFDELLKYIHHGWLTALGSLQEPTLANYKTPEIDAKVAFREQQCAPLVNDPKVDRIWPRYRYSRDDGQKSDDGTSWGSADSEFLSLQSYVIELLKETDFPDTLFNFHAHVKPYRRDIPRVDPAKVVPEGEGDW